MESPGKSQIKIEFIFSTVYHTVMESYREYRFLNTDVFQSALLINLQEIRLRLLSSSRISSSIFC